MSNRKKIYIKNINPAVKDAMVNYSKNLGYPTFNKFQIDFLNETINKYTPKSENLEKKIPAVSVETKNNRLEIQSVPKLIHTRLNIIAEKLGFKNVSEFLRFEMHIKCSDQPAHMLKKNKGFEELPEAIKVKL